MRKNEVKIGTLGKACIYQNEYDVWQFRTWLADENKYYRISLRTKQRADALEKAEDLYAEMRVAKKQGKKYFSISIKDAVAKYLEFRKKDVGKGRGAGIVEGRYGTIKAHLNHFLNYVHKDAKVKDLGKNTLVEYEREGITTDYIRFRKQQKAADSTIRNEVATINSCIRYLHECDENYAEISAFRIPKQKSKAYKADEATIRRQTFTREEWEMFYKAMRTYASKQKCKDEKDYLDKQLVRHYLLFAANSGGRSGELRKLKWNSVLSYEKQKTRSGNELLLAEIQVEADTSKVGIGRTFYARGGKYLQRWKELLQKSGVDISGNKLIFSIDGETEYWNSTLNRHFKKIMQMTEIDEERRSGLVPYSLRHFYITSLAYSGVSFADIAFQCGTSVSQIERTYYHLNKAKRLQVATAEYKEVDGKIVAITDLNGD